MQKRRDFLKLTAAGATGLTLVRASDAFAAWPSSGTMAINPDISNMRVVGLVDPAMVPTTPSTMTLAAQNTAVDTARVQANLDAMAMALAGKCTPDEAWKTIFRSSRPWATTVVAIKLNSAEPKNSPRVAVVDKLCRVLSGFGVPSANIFLYDGHGGTYSYSSYCSKTDASKIPAVVDSSGMGGQIEVPLPDGTTAQCAKQIADGTVDILINIPTNKGHTAFGGATLSLKNHFGTFAPNHFCPPSDAGNFCSNPDTTKFYNYVFTISKSDAIIGGTPARQQLCVVDSLFANKANNTGTPEVMPCYLIMGTFGPAVDYLTIKQVREKVMNATHTKSLVDQYMTQFGYTAADPVWVQVPPAGTDDAGACGSGGTDAGGTTGSGGAGSGGAKGGSGGSSGSGGAGKGSAAGTGGSGSGGASSSGGSSIKGSGGASVGGAQGSSGGSQGSGGASAGGSTALGGSVGGGGSGGAATSSASAAGGSMASGGTTGAGTAGASAGCGCDLGGLRRSASGFGAVLAVGVVAAGQLKRLFDRREELARTTPLDNDAKLSADGQSGHKHHNQEKV